MLREAIEYFLTPCDPVFRKMGYLKELIAIEARFRRVGSCWAYHQEKTRETICGFVSAQEETGRVIVMGAGLLLDIPLGYLSENCNEVVLVDVVFSRKVRALARRHPNVRILAHDVTGLARELVFNRQDVLPEPSPSLPMELQPGDLLLSINILSQLPLLPLHYARKKTVEMETVLENWATRIVGSHIDWLGNLSLPALLVTDSTHRLKGRDGDILETYDCLYGNPLPDTNDEWIWSYAPQGELARGFSVDAVVSSHAWYRN